MINNISTILQNFGYFLPRLLSAWVIFCKINSWLINVLHPVGHWLGIHNNLCCHLTVYLLMLSSSRQTQYNHKLWVLVRVWREDVPRKPSGESLWKYPTLHWFWLAEKYYLICSLPALGVKTKSLWNTELAHWIPLFSYPAIYVALRGFTINPIRVFK